VNTDRSQRGHARFHHQTQPAAGLGPPAQDLCQPAGQDHAQGGEARHALLHEHVDKGIVAIDDIAHMDPQRIKRKGQRKEPQAHARVRIVLRQREALAQQLQAVTECPGAW